MSGTEHPSYRPLADAQAAIELAAFYAGTEIGARSPIAAIGSIDDAIRDLWKAREFLVAEQLAANPAADDIAAAHRQGSTLPDAPETRISTHS